MPALISHWLLGKRLLPVLNERTKLAGMDLNGFLWGCQGPDVLLFSRVSPFMIGGKNYREYGSRIHDDRPSGLFGVMGSMLDSYSGEDRLRMLGYCMGMCCHYSLDRIAHPYVNWLEDKLKRSARPGFKARHYHGRIESMLDIILLRHETGLLPTDVDMTECVPDDSRVAEMIASVFTNVLEKIYSVKADKRSIGLLASDTRSCVSLLNDRHALKRPMVKHVERMTGYGDRISAFMRPVTERLDCDYANLCHNEWYNLMKPEDRSRADFMELFQTAVDDAANMTECFMKVMRGEGSFARYTEERTFSNNIDETALREEQK